jgi:hypothetical protein
MKIDKNSPSHRKSPNAQKAAEPNLKLKTFRKGKAGINERDYPYLVEIAVPVGGLDLRQNREIAAFHRLHNIRPRFGKRRTEGIQDYSRWCFSDPGVADAFRERFGGERVTIKPQP